MVGTPRAIPFIGKERELRDPPFLSPFILSTRNKLGRRRSPFGQTNNGRDRNRARTMDELSAAVTEAVTAAGITEHGRRDAQPCPWVGLGTADEKRQVAGSIIKLSTPADNGAEFAYVPVTPGGVPVKQQTLKLSMDGSERGSYCSVQEVSDKSDVVWAAICKVGEARGARANGVRIGGVPMYVVPVHEDGKPFQFVRLEGEDGAVSAPMDIEAAALHVGQPVTGWMPWGGVGARVGTMTPRAGLAPVAAGRTQTADVAAKWPGQGGSVLGGVFSMLGLPTPVPIGDMADMVAAVAGVAIAASAVAVCLQAAAERGDAPRADAGEERARMAAIAAGERVVRAMSAAIGGMPAHVAAAAKATEEQLRAAGMGGPAGLGRTAFDRSLPPTRRGRGEQRYLIQLEVQGRSQCRRACCRRGQWQ